MESFKGKWPSKVAQTPEKLSSAGFYYVGKSFVVNRVFEGTVDFV